MKLYQAICTFDVVVAAKDEKDAYETLLKEIRGYMPEEAFTSPPLGVSTLVAMEIRDERNIRSAMRDVSPIVGEGLTDDEFKKIKGKTNLVVFGDLYKKGPK